MSARRRASPWRGRGASDVRVTVVVDGLERPWGLAFLPGDEGILVTERPGRLRRVRDGRLEPGLAAVEELREPVPPGATMAQLHAPAARGSPHDEREVADSGTRHPAEVIAIMRRGDTRTLRYLRPINAGPPCLTCHGQPSEIPSEVAELLRERYPEDRATGYRAGDLRGAVSVEVELAPS